MSATNKMVNCEKCFKYYNSVIYRECSFCRNYSFQENILCDLNRSSQITDSGIECYAYKPNLSVVGENKEIYEGVQYSDKKLELSDRLKWLKAYALQQWKYDPDKIFANLNYHVCLITKKREKLFENIINRSVETTAIFNNIANQFDGKMGVLYVSSDHMHIHIESSPDYSVDEVISKSIVSLEFAIKTEFSKSFGEKKEIFENSYFIETIG